MNALNILLGKNKFLLGENLSVHDFFFAEIIENMLKVFRDLKIHD